MPFFSFREGIFGRLEKILKVFGLGADIQKRTIRWWLLTKRPLGASRLSQASNSSLAGEVRNAGDFQAAVTLAGHFAPRCEAPPPLKSKSPRLGSEEPNLDSRLSPPHPSLQQKTVEARKEKDPKDLGRYEAQQREGNFTNDIVWMRTFRWWLGVFLVQGDFRLMPQSEWQRIYGRFEAMGDFSPVVFWWMNPKKPTGRPHPEKRSPCDRCQRQGAFDEFQYFGGCRCQRKAVRIPMETLSGRFPLYAAIGMGFHLCPLQGSFRKGREPSLRRVKAEYGCFQK